MKEIKLTQGKFAKVDNEDFEKVNRYKWFYDKQYNRAVRNIRISETQKRKTISMPTGILQINKIIDHRDGNRLNNQKYNLRACTQAQNMQNRKKQKGKTASRYKGVAFHKGTQKRQAEIQFCDVSGKKSRKYLGLFESEKEAARAYDTAARAYHRKFAALNFPKENEQSCLWGR